MGIVIINERLAVGLTGISSSGKSTLADLLKDALIEFTDVVEEDVTVLHLDNFYRPIDEVYEIQGLNKIDNITKVNWDDPNLINYDRLIGVLNELQEIGETEVNVYDKKTGTYKGETETVIGNKLVIVESFLLFSSGVPMRGNYSSRKKKEPVLSNPKETSDRIFELIPYRVFVDCDKNVAWLRRLARDAHKVPRTYEESNQLWTRDAWPAALEYIFPLRELKPEGIFDRFWENSVLSVSDIDYVFWDIVNQTNMSIKSEYARDFMSRQEWIEDRYRKGTINEAQWIYELFTKRNGLVNP